MYLILYHINSYHIISGCIAPCHDRSYHFISMSYSYHFISMFYCIISYHMVSYYVALHYTTLHNINIQYIIYIYIVCYILSHVITLCCTWSLHQHPNLILEHGSLSRLSFASTLATMAVGLRGHHSNKRVGATAHLSCQDFTVCNPKLVRKEKQNRLVSCSTSEQRLKG